MPFLIKPAKPAKACVASKRLKLKLFRMPENSHSIFRWGKPVNRGLHNVLLQIIIQNSICNIKLILDFEFTQKNNKVLSYADLNNFHGKCRKFRASIRRK